MYTKVKLVLVLAVIMAFPSGAHAASVFLESSRSSISVGDTAVISVKINADGKVINTVEGEVGLNSTGGTVLVQEFSLANSAFGLWPLTPSLSEDGKKVSFVGGVPGGFSIEGATLFKIVVEATKPGPVTISPQNISVYENDGQGTRLPVTFKNISINVTPATVGSTPVNDWEAAVLQDTSKPEEFIIVPGQNPSIFEGKKFVFFSAVDNQTGIDYYEVSENGGPAVRSGSTYVLQDQSEDVELEVTAYDKAGNRRVAMYSAQEGIAWPFIIIVVLLGVVLKLVYKKWKKRNAAIAS